MAGAFKSMNRLRTLLKGGALISAAAVTAKSTNASMIKSKTVNYGKDQVLFISKEDNFSTPEVKITVRSDLTEDRGVVLPNGDINMACSCIEKGVVGPCNIEFRKVRTFMHENKIEDIESFSEDVASKLEKLFEDYIMCTMDYPVYYQDEMIDEEKEDMEKEKERKEKMLQSKRMAREANTRNFGKDTVVFVTKDEATSKCSVLVPKVQFEEDRGPLNPDGSVNFACTCIEKDVIGPCNLEFRAFRELIASKSGTDMDEPFTEDERQCIHNFIMCIHANPLYYASYLQKEKEELNSKDGNSADSDDRKETV